MTYTAEQETKEIMNDAVTMQALATAENDVILASFTAGIIKIAHEAQVWGSTPGIGMPDEMVWSKVSDLMEQALRARGNIRARYGVTRL